MISILQAPKKPETAIILSINLLDLIMLPVRCLRDPTEAASQESINSQGPIGSNERFADLENGCICMPCQQLLIRLRTAEDGEHRLFRIINGKTVSKYPEHVEPWVVIGLGRERQLASNFIVSEICYCLIGFLSESQRQSGFEYNHVFDACLFRSF